MRSEKSETPKTHIADLNRISVSIKNLVNNGFTEQFTATPRGLYALRNCRYYRPEQIKIRLILKQNTDSKNDQNVLAYILESSDGVRGIMIDYFDKKPNPLMAKFITQTEEVQRKLELYNRQHKH
ncbi:MAG: hypothetical protein ABI378_15510 [Chitinophagaceae bacterium]